MYCKGKHENDSIASLAGEETAKDGWNALFPDYMVELCTKGILDGVHFADRRNGVTDENVPINWSYEFSGAVNYLPTCKRYSRNLREDEGIVPWEKQKNALPNWCTVYRMEISMGKAVVYILHKIIS